MNHAVTIRRLATGVPGLDAILGGGLPDLPFNLIGDPLRGTKGCSGEARNRRQTSLTATVAQ